MPHNIDIRVYYEDTDMAGIVYHANYLRYLERARSEAVRAAGIDQLSLRRDRGLAFAVRNMSIDFIAAAQFDDILSVSCEMKKIGGASLEMIQEIHRGDLLILRAKVRLAILSKNGRAIRIPASLRQKFVAHFQHANQG